MEGKDISVKSAAHSIKRLALENGSQSSRRGLRVVQKSLPRLTGGEIRRQKTPQRLTLPPQNVALSELL